MLPDDHIHQSNLIEGYEHPYVDEISRDAWGWLIKQQKITTNTVCQLQKRITLFQTDLRPDQRGYYRQTPIQSINGKLNVNGHLAIQPQKIPQAMKNLIDVIEITHPKAWHIEFERIHPFVDGNGRTGRMLMWWMEIKSGKAPTLITYLDRSNYYAWFEK